MQLSWLALTVILAGQCYAQEPNTEAGSCTANSCNAGLHCVEDPTSATGGTCLIKPVSIGSKCNATYIDCSFHIVC
ncbi:hypothetical protein BDR26DRAFT_855467 [Obelidium mucronatum]|nr:hypothetical protein BDR26DRAFT_855467 [Obelidium mucronatum]